MCAALYSRARGRLAGSESFDAVHVKVLKTLLPVALNPQTSLVEQLQRELNLSRTSSGLADHAKAAAGHDVVR